MSIYVKRILLIVWIIVIFVLTGYPTLETPKIKEFPVDKVYHFIVFLILGLLEMPILRPRNFFLLGFAIALLAEIQQIFIPGRDFEILDIVAGLVGLTIIFFILRLRKGLKNDLSKA